MIQTYITPWDEILIADVFLPGEQVKHVDYDWVIGVIVGVVDDIITVLWANYPEQD
jgi:hypothetical protein